MKYKVETHLHTKQGSACARISGAEQARARKAEGYDCIIVTDHFYRGNTRPERSLAWQEYVKEFCAGYREAKAEGERIGLRVLFGWEDNYKGAEFLCYGPDEAWLAAHPQMRDWTPRQLYEEVKAAGGMVIQAHPFRQRTYLSRIALYPDDCDGAEVYNLSQPMEQNKRAVWYAREFGLRMTAGSDIHGMEGIGGGMVFSRPILTIQDYIQAVLAGEPCELLCGVASGKDAESSGEENG